MPFEVLYVKVEPASFPSQLRVLEVTEGLGETEELGTVVELLEKVAELTDELSSDVAWIVEGTAEARCTAARESKAKDWRRIVLGTMAKE